MSSDLPLKLRVTAVLLGCSGRKELCARFRAVNPATHFDLDRSNKWFQGRGQPRSHHVYDDWAKVLGIARTGTWIATCDLAAFLCEVGDLFGIEPEALLRQAEDAASGTGPTALPRTGFAGDYLCGEYICYSLAWSPYFLGRIISARLLIEPSRRGTALAAEYSEALPGGVYSFRGEVILTGRTVHIGARSSPSGPPLFISLYMPGPPASALCGVMSGSIVIGHDPQPCATRIVLVRVPSGLPNPTGYLPPEPGVIASDLIARGLSLGAPEEADQLVRAFLLDDSAGGLMQVMAADQARFSAMFDKAYLAGAELVSTSAFGQP